ncbi:MAG: YkgJ family cysteine cluster protein [Pyrinomonadaceae bacterium]|nr:YkgJ family cysteine cluster protein [Pyrinomonadaceae bacterium]
MEERDFVQITRQKTIPESDVVPMANWMFEEVWSKLLPMQILTENLSFSVKDNVITPPDAPVPDCMSCGACCAAFVYVSTAPGNDLADADCWKIVKNGRKRTITVDRLIRRRRSDKSCVALEGRLGEQVSCRIYNERPQMCRKFEAGSDRCHAVRRAYGFEPFLTLEEMSDAKAKLEQAGKQDRSNTIKRAIIDESDEENKFTISAELHDGSAYLIHSFDPRKETWFQSEIEGLTLEAAAQMIKNRS